MLSTQAIPQSWGRYPRVKPARVVPIYWRDQLPDLRTLPGPLLAYGYGRSYGDSCLNENGTVLVTSHLRRFLAFDEEQGLLRCEAGVSLAEVLDLIVPRGWFLPVSPGTKFVSVGGAIANDIHGKNHHKAGTFGCHVTRFELLRSNGERLACSPTENRELFEATIGGLGLTGLILWAEFRLKRIHNPYIDMERIRYDSLEEFMELCAESDEQYEYTVAWVDCLASGSKLGRGIFMRGNHNQSPDYARKPLPRKLPLAVPVDLPSFTLNTLTLKIFNTLYDHSQLQKRVFKVIPYEPFFYPLDSIHDWNRMYGPRGFFQYQCVVPYDQGYDVMKEILQRISRSGQGSFLAVLKKFGDVRSPGLLSFPRPGLTLALDFANQGPKTLRLFDELDALVRESGGALYPAKDARMHGEDFKRFFPRWQEFMRYVDPKFSSSFWRRMALVPSREQSATVEV
ncbi:MAG: FAD-binding oxidoreductase [Thermogemmatispora sp.]|uniref:FAD-binding oxidoreductase n=1 Tax=Thermogemmatispora sp. TaxID=1968838 RepID=UPI0019DB4CA5|nr:FAD-binding oxidoreductase [Thermogemmatispora sp.]MBE3565454.1 FAD-binding oxidoreductase [Thermogemmatispora sp.]